MNTKLHAVTDANGRLISFFMTGGQVSDGTGAAALFDSLPKAEWMLADGAMMPTGSTTACRKRGSPSAFRAGKHAQNPTNRTSVDTKSRNRT
ncbi:transposase [Sphingopyxis yananensis]|uniref:transposase n=1 Tax=Sphingopyxis yananensis TaxID=2886687 RepID=UPI00389B3185